MRPALLRRALWEATFSSPWGPPVIIHGGFLTVSHRIHHGSGFMGMVYIDLQSAGEGVGRSL